MNDSASIAKQVSNLDIPLERDVFMRTLIRELSNTLQKVVGSDQASGFISVVGQVMGKQMDNQYRQALNLSSATQSIIKTQQSDLLPFYSEHTLASPGLESAILRYHGWKFG